MLNRICISFSFLLLGAIIYMLFRPEVLFLVHFPNDFISKISIDIDASVISTCPFMYFVVFCLPDALWYAALLIFQSAIYVDNLTSKLVLVFSILFPFIHESMQKIGMLSGTFDWLDIITYLLTLILLLCTKKVFYQFLF